MKRYLNIRNNGSVETIDELDSNDFESLRAFKAELRRLYGEYMTSPWAGQKMYWSSR